MTTEKTSSATLRGSATVNIDNPWPGLLAYSEADQEFFFGRQLESDELFRLVMRKPLTVFFGLSGLGKTSLLQAGLFPRLRQENVLPIYIRLGFSPDHPSLVNQVKQIIASETAAIGVEAPAGREDETLWEYFHRKDADFWNDRNRILLPLLVFDQFEEIFTFGRSELDRENDVEAFLMELGNLTEGHPPIALKNHLDAHPKDADEFSFGRQHYKILISLREDFVPDLEGLRDRIPSITGNHIRIRRMNGASALQVVAQARHLIKPKIAERVVRFVAAKEDSESLLENLEVEPALLSVVCLELNNKRQRRKELSISEDLLEGSREEILSGFYGRSVSDFTQEVQAFIEERLLTITGYRDSVALENALNVPGVTRDVIDRMVNRRLIRIEEQAGRQRLELTHDLLTGVIAASRDHRHRLEAVEKREKEIIEKERQQRLEERAQSARRFRRLSIVLALLFILALFAFYRAWEQKKIANKQYVEATIQREIAEKERKAANEARFEAEKQRQVAERESKIAEKAKAEANQRYQRITESLKLRQAVLSRNEKTLLEAFEKIPLETQIKFRAIAKEYPYKSRTGLPTYKYQMFPIEESIPGGFESIALITYIMDHPTFLNRLYSTGPDSKFTATYDGIGCLSEVTTVIEYSDLDKPLALAEFDMCDILKTIPLKKQESNK